VESRDDEARKFRIEISIIDVAERLYGFEIDYEKCTRGNVQRQKNIVMKNGRDTILVSRDDTWKFWDTARDKSSHGEIGGDIFNFVQWQEGGRETFNLGKVRQKLRSFSGQHPPIVSRPKQENNDIKIKDLDFVRKFIAERSHAETSNYLEGRGISQQTLQNPLFKNRVLKGFDGAVIFPHFDATGVCGYEVRSTDLKTFTKKGFKGLWYSQIPLPTERIIFVESAIEALSHYQLKQPKNAAYYSPGGNWDPDTVGKLIEKVMQKYPDAKIVSAFNNDEGGEKHAQKLDEHASRVGRTTERDMPKTLGNDWNNDLTTRLAAPDDLKKKQLNSLSR